MTPIEVLAIMHPDYTAMALTDGGTWYVYKGTPRKKHTAYLCEDPNGHYIQGSTCEVSKSIPIEYEGTWVESLVTREPQLDPIEELLEYLYAYSSHLPNLMSKTEAAKAFYV